MAGLVRNRSLRIAAVVLLALVVAACEPPRPSVGRGTPVRRVLVVGDSITHGMFGTSPNLNPFLVRNMSARGISTYIGGFAAENPIAVWPDHPRWADVVRERVRNWDPDVVIIQSILFADAGKPDKRNEYLTAMRELLDAAQSRGAHTYLVTHPTPPRATEAANYAVAKDLQGRAGAGRGVSWIPLDWWLAHCRSPYIDDGWHLSGNGQACWADAITAAVDQLRNSIGRG